MKQTQIVLNVENHLNSGQRQNMVYFYVKIAQRSINKIQSLSMSKISNLVNGNKDRLSN